jgi:signal transduction histidine kinase
MLSFARGRLSRRVLIEAALLILVVADAVGSVLSDENAPYQWALAAVAILSLSVRTRAPYLVLVLTLPAVATESAVLAAMVALFTVAQRRPARLGIVVGGAAFFVCYTTLWDQSYPSVDTLLNLVYATIFTAAPVWLGMLISARSDLSDKLLEVERARRHEDELIVERTRAEERAGLAREMHDVVSHQVSLIAVQAGALQVTATDEASLETARTIRMLSVRTLDELREMVGVLRAAEKPAVDLAPQPGIDDIAALVAGAQVPTTIDTVDRLGSPPSAPVQRAVYRAVQEGLTNIAKHAPGASASLVLRLDPREVSVSLTNTKPTRPAEQLPSSQRGLLGLRERAELLGGALSAERCGDGGYRLTMTLPIHP